MHLTVCSSGTPIAVTKVAGQLLRPRSGPSLRSASAEHCVKIIKEDQKDYASDLAARVSSLCANRSRVLLICDDMTESFSAKIVQKCGVPSLRGRWAKPVPGNWRNCPTKSRSRKFRYPCLAANRLSKSTKDCMCLARVI